MSPVTARPVVAVVAGTAPLLRAVHALGVDAVFVHAEEDGIPAAAGNAETVAVPSLDDHDAVRGALERTHRTRGLARVLSLTESGLVPAAEAAERLGVPGNPARTVRLLKDKRRMRALLAAHGLGTVRHRAVDSAADLADFLAVLRGPAVLKPATGAGSHAVVRVEGPGGARTAWRRFTAAGGTDAIAEEYLDGTEISVECFSAGGRHTPVAVTDKLLGDHFVERGHTVPSRLPAAERDRAVDLVLAFLDLIGLREGPTHTELRLTPAGPRIIESHDRIGGDKIRELVLRAYGVDLAALTVGVPLGLLPAPAGPVPARAGAAIRFLCPPPGVVRSVSPPEPAAPGTVVSVDVRPGDRVREVRRSEDRAGYVLAEGPGPDQAERLCEETLARVRIDTGAVTAGAEG
ncbi:ATP-grasp domain-containing protein [Nocardiopsis sp. CC223A]|uniref:ATP-grasp domain-containing protein n=1 Tax=Nocardiopsis sp. CC223A TaxID=3044051 RepID=UPI00278C8C6A|nr:ATP-grasp domain-containing protein [Nocardiopsis sp. CC223A]